MSNIITMNYEIAMKYFNNPKLYKATKYVDVAYKLYIPAFLNQITNPYTGMQYVTSNNTPYVVESLPKDFEVVSLKSLCENFVFSDGQLINGQSLKAKWSEPEKMGKSMLTAKSGKNYISIKPSEALLNMQFMAVHVPVNLCFMSNDGRSCVNNPKVKNHGKSGDYIVRAVKGTGELGGIFLVNGALFEHKFNLTHLNESYIKTADKRVFEALNDRYSY